MHVSKENVACKKLLQNFKSMPKPQGTPWSMLKNVGVSSEYLTTNKKALREFIFKRRIVCVFLSQPIKMDLNKK